MENYRATFNSSDFTADTIIASDAIIDNLSLSLLDIKDQTISGTLTLSALDSSKVLQTDANKNVITSNTINNPILTGTTDVENIDISGTTITKGVTCFNDIGGKQFEIDPTTKNINFYLNGISYSLSWNSSYGRPMFKQTSSGAGYPLVFSGIWLGGPGVSDGNGDTVLTVRNVSGYEVHKLTPTNATFTAATLSGACVCNGSFQLSGTALTQKLNVLNGSGSSVFYVSSTNGAMVAGAITSNGTADINGNFTVKNTNSTTKFRVLDASNNVLFLINTTTPSISIGNATRPTAINFVNGTSNSFMKLDASNNVVYDTNTYLTTTDAASTYLTIANAASTYQPIITGAATTITSTDLTPLKALISDSLGKVNVSSVTSTELGYLSGVTSAIQTQINSKLSILDAEGQYLKSINPIWIMGNFNTPLTANRAMIIDGSKNVTISPTTSTELSYVSGVTSAIQTQLNTKAPTTNPTFSGTITTPLTANQIVSTNGSSQLSTLPYSSSQVTSSNIVQTDANGYINATRMVFSGTATVGGYNYGINLRNTSTGGTGIRFEVNSGVDGYAIYTNADGSLNTSHKSIVFKPVTNNTSYFKVQNSTGTNILECDVTNQIVKTVNVSTTGYNSIGGANNSTKFGVSDSIGNTILNVSTIASGDGYCPITMDQAKLSVGNLGSSSFVQTDSSGYLTTSKTLSGATLSGTTTLSGSIIPNTNNTQSIGSSTVGIATVYTNNSQLIKDANHFALSSVQFTNVPQGTGTTAVLTIPFKTGFTDGNCCIIKVLGVANGGYNNGAVQYFESTSGCFYQASIWKFIGSAPTITYTGGGLFSYYWYISGSNLQIIANQNSGQSGNVTIKYEIVYGTKN